MKNMMNKTTTTTTVTPNGVRPATRLDDARESWRKAYYLACDLVSAVERLPKDHMDDAGIAKFALLIDGKAKVASGLVSIVCAAGMKH